MTDLAPTFTSLAQRAASSYLRALAPAPEDAAPARRALRAFFGAFYQALFDDPARFGLPIEPDDCITGAEKDRTQKMAYLNRRLQKPRDLIASGLNWLMQVGSAGRLTAASPAQGQALLLGEADYAALLLSARVKKPFLAGLAEVGLEISSAPGSVIIRSPRYPAMLPALQQLASACCQLASACWGAASQAGQDPKRAAFNFARCDFQALDDPARTPSALDLYRFFSADDYQRLARLHAYYTDRGYQALIGACGIHDWDVQYQGDRKVKGTPLAQVHFAERFQNQLQVSIKCASTPRIAPLIAAQPRALQEDFFQRTFPCGDCGWCRNKKTLGPTVIEFDGQQKRACWYVLPDIKEFNDAALALIQDYTVLHESLA